MDARQKIERAIEQRKAEAVEKNLSRKLTLVAAHMGQPIIMQGAGGSTDAFGFEQYQHWSVEDDEDHAEIPICEDSSSTIGWHYDGLNIGINIQILHFKIEDKLRVTYDGSTVYEEHQHKLLKYLPSPQWEDKLESLYQVSTKRARLKDQDQKADEKIAAESYLVRVREFLRNNWGI